MASEVQLSPHLHVGGISQRWETPSHSILPRWEPRPQGGPALPPCPVQTPGSVRHPSAREWETEPRRLSLRSLKVVKESSQRRDRDHRKSQQTTHKRSGCNTVRRDKSDGRRVKGNGRRVCKDHASEQLPGGGGEGLSARTPAKSPS